MDTDLTPFDTDFAEINGNIIEDCKNDKHKAEGIIGSTCAIEYGPTFYLIKNDDYDENKTYAGSDSEGNNWTRFCRTAIGSNKIRAIFTNEWQDEYSYILAQNGIYIPVIDYEIDKLWEKRRKGRAYFGT